MRKRLDRVGVVDDGMVGQSNGSVYVATKGALISMTKALALELGGDGIRVNCVCPAGVDTRRDAQLG